MKKEKKEKNEYINSFRLSFVLSHHKQIRASRM